MKTIINNSLLNWNEIENQYWAKEMKKCMQEYDYHGEGDVYTHTKMVVDELMKISDFQKLDNDSKDITLLASLFHDIGKPKTTIIENNKISSPKHSQFGEGLAREILWDYDFYKRESICSIVRLHGLPVWSINKSDAIKKVILSSLRVKNELLYLVSKADMLGRICNDMDSLVFNVELFKELSLDNECFYNEKSFYNSHSKFKYFDSDELYPPQIYDSTEFEITILSGLPGSGKDTYASQFDLPIVSLDDLRIKYKVKRGDKKGESKVIKEAYDIAKSYCRKKQSFIWNSTNITYDMRSRVINNLKVYNPKINIVYLETSLENIRQRRENEINYDSLYRMFKMLDIPQKSEAHSVVYIRH